MRKLPRGPTVTPLEPKAARTEGDKPLPVEVCSREEEFYFVIRGRAVKTKSLLLLLLLVSETTTCTFGQARPCAPSAQP